jgi:hypothetical protein
MRPKLAKNLMKNLKEGRINASFFFVGSQQFLVAGFSKSFMKDEQHVLYPNHPSTK